MLAFRSSQSRTGGALSEADGALKPNAQPLRAAYDPVGAARW